jgi:hypothetical protein
MEGTAPPNSEVDEPPTPRIELPPSPPRRGARPTSYSSPRTGVPPIMLPRSLMMLPRSEAEAHHSRPRADGSLASAFALHAPPPYADPQDAYDADDNEEGEKEDGEVSAYFLRRPVSRRAASASSRCTSTPSSGLLTPDPSCPAMSPEIYGFAPVQTDGDESDLFPSFANLSLSSSSHRSSPSPTTPITPHTTRRPRPRSAASPITPQRQPRSQAPSPWYESPLRHDSSHRCVTPPRAHPSPPLPPPNPCPAAAPTYARARNSFPIHCG